VRESGLTRTTETRYYWPTQVRSFGLAPKAVAQELSEQRSTEAAEKHQFENNLTYNCHKYFVFAELRNERNKKGR
jgi:hypothetical protein